MKKKKPWFAALLSVLLPGLGQVYALRFKRGILILPVLFLLAVISRYIAANIYLFAAIVLFIFASYLLVVIDAFRLAKKAEGRSYGRFDRWYIYLVFVVIVNTVISIKEEAIKNGYKKITAEAPYQLYTVPSTAMSPALEVGDYFMMRKSKDIARNDLTVFRYPNDRQAHYVKRCAGMPGDSLQIKEGLVYANGISYDIPQRLKFRYFVRTNGEQLNKANLDALGIDCPEHANGIYDCFLKLSDSAQLATIPTIREITRYRQTAGLVLYPGSRDFDWTLDFFGPIYIPRKGDKISLDKNNFTLYAKCIRFESPDEFPDAFSNTEGLTSEYTFKQNYYFVMGDNRYNSEDSRFWGLLPESLIVGKAKYFIWLKDWKQIGKPVI